jgi:hypothetical protein
VTLGAIVKKGRKEGGTRFKGREMKWQPEGDMDSKKVF